MVSFYFLLLTEKTLALQNLIIKIKKVISHPNRAIRFCFLEAHPKKKPFFDLLRGR